MSLFSKKIRLPKVILTTLLCFMTMPAQGMMGRLRTGFQSAKQAASLYRSSFARTCVYTVPRTTLNTITTTQPFTKKHSASWVPAAAALGAFVAYSQDSSDRWAKSRAYAQKEFREFEDQQNFVEMCINMTFKSDDHKTIERFTGLKPKHQAALLTFCDYVLDAYRLNTYMEIYISSVINECKEPTLSFSEEQLNLFLHLPGEWQAKLLVYFADRLTDDQIANIVNTPQIINHIKNNDWFWKNKMNPEQMSIFAHMVLKNGSPEFKKLFFYKVYVHLYVQNAELIDRSDRYGCAAGNWQELKQWTDAIGLYDSLEQTEGQGPLFSEFNKNLLFKLHTPHAHPNVDALLPEIAEYTAEEYRQDRIVLFHAHAAIWIGLGALYRALDEYKHERKLPSTFFHTRFWTHSPLSENDVAKKELRWQRGSDQNILLFTTLHFADGSEGNNTLQCILESFDQMAMRGLSRDDLIKKMFIELDMVPEYQKLLAKKPTIFSELCDLCDEAIEEQGNYGQLLVISMPKKLAGKLSYLSNDYGEKKYVYIDGVKTSDTVTIAKHFEKSPFNKQIVLKLSEEIVNPEAAEKAEVKIVAFDPAFYWRTEKYLKVKAKLNEIIEVIRNQEIIESERAFL